MSYHYPHHVGKLPIRRGSNSERVADLLSRYPGVTEAEAQEIVTFIRNGRHLDIALLTANDAIGPNLDAFRQDHEADFRVKWREGAGVTGAILIMIALWLIFEMLA